MGRTNAMHAQALTATRPPGPAIIPGIQPCLLSGSFRNKNRTERDKPRCGGSLGRRDQKQCGRVSGPVAWKGGRRWVVAGRVPGAPNKARTSNALRRSTLCDRVVIGLPPRWDFLLNDSFSSKNEPLPRNKLPNLPIMRMQGIIVISAARICATGLNRDSEAG